MSVRFFDTEAPASAAAVREAERQVGRPLPGPYKDFVMATNGGRPVPSGFRIQWSGQEWARGWEQDVVQYFLAVQEGGAENFSDYLTTHRGRVPDDTVPIARDPGGNLLLIGVGDKNNGRIFFWMRDYEPEDQDGTDYSNVGAVAPTLAAFLDGLRDAP